MAAVWAYAGEILVWFRQDRAIAAGAGSYTRRMLPALLLFGQLQCHVRFLQPQNVVVPVMAAELAITGTTTFCGCRKRTWHCSWPTPSPTSST